MILYNILVGQNIVTHWLNITSLHSNTRMQCDMLLRRFVMTALLNDSWCYIMWIILCNWIVQWCIVIYSSDDTCDIWVNDALGHIGWLTHCDILVERWFILCTTYWLDDSLGRMCWWFMLTYILVCWLNKTYVVVGPLWHTCWSIHCDKFIGWLIGTYWFVDSLGHMCWMIYCYILVRWFVPLWRRFMVIWWAGGLVV